MKKIRSLAFFVAALLCSLPACRKHSETPDPLPPATQEGKNTFGCYIDGKPWVAGIAPYVLDPTLHKLSSYYDQPGIGGNYNNPLGITATRVDSFSYDYIQILARPVFQKGVLRQEDGIFINFFASLSKSYDFDTSFAYNLELTKFDTFNFICSGVFEFRGISQNKQDTILITDGRFDVRYSPE